jgi:hypothetical protein
MIIISRKYTRTYDTVAYLHVLRYVLLVNELRLSGPVSVFIHGAFSTKKSNQKPQLLVLLTSASYPGAYLQY